MLVVTQDEWTTACKSGCEYVGLVVQDFFAYWTGLVVDGKTIFRASKLFPQVSWLRHPLIPNAVPDLLTVSISSPIELLYFLKPGKHFKCNVYFLLQLHCYGGAE